jgi:L-aspartate oxidase
LTHPLLIVGAGIAGLWTALKAAPQPVVLLTGAPLGEGSSTGWAQGGVAAALGPDDSAALHARDTVMAGAGLVDETAAMVLARPGPVKSARCMIWAPGLNARTDGGWALSREAAHSVARVARMKGDQAGAGILAALIEAVRAADHIEIREGWRAEALLPDLKAGCAGVLARDPDGKLAPIEAAHTVLATGSLGGLYAVTTTPWTSQGQALAMAAELGAVIRDPEFVQFHPTAIDIGRDPAPLATEALRGDGAVLVDRKGSSLHAGRA